jgi:hypothetical protein
MVVQLWLAAFALSSVVFAANKTKPSSIDISATTVEKTETLPKKETPEVEENIRNTTADALVVQGLQLRRQSKNAEALGFFQQAFRILPSPRIQAQVGLAHQALGHWVLAERHLVSAMQYHSDPWLRKHRDALRKALAIVQEHLGWIVVKANNVEARVWIASVLVDGPLSEPFRCETGQLTLEVRAPGFVPLTRQLTVIAGKTSEEVFMLEPEPADSARGAELAPLVEQANQTRIESMMQEKPITPTSVPNSTIVPLQTKATPTRYRLSIVSALGVGTAALGFAAYFGWRVLDAKAAANQYCDRDSCWDLRGVRLDEERRRNAIACNAALGFAALGFGSALVLSIATPPSSLPIRSINLVPTGDTGAVLYAQSSW